MQNAFAAEQQYRQEADQAAAAIGTRPSAAASSGMVDEVRDLVCVLLPNICMHRDSIEVIATEFASRWVVWRALGELATSNGAPRDWKKIRGDDSWWERHLRNGRDNSGRVYARPGGRATREVLISHKTE